MEINEPEITRLYPTRTQGGDHRNAAELVQDEHPKEKNTKITQQAAYMETPLPQRQLRIPDYTEEVVASTVPQFVVEGDLWAAFRDPEAFITRPHSEVAPQRPLLPPNGDNKGGQKPVDSRAGPTGVSIDSTPRHSPRGSGHFARGQR
ncbi:hypothetical protein MRX96_004938 [Rhipicephalus microplus]